MKKSYFFPTLLIVIGVVLLLNQFGLLGVTRPYLFVSGSAVIGILMLRKAFNSPQRDGLLGGSFFIFFTFILLFLDLGVLPYYDYLIIGVILTALGLSNFIYYIFTQKTFNNITFGLIFAAAGAPFIIMYYKSLSVWDIWDVFYAYWPVLLIAAGVGFLLDGVLKKAK